MKITTPTQLKIEKREKKAKQKNLFSFRNNYDHAIGIEFLKFLRFTHNLKSVINEPSFFLLFYIYMCIIHYEIDRYCLC